ncbi:MAG: hypothetical protein HKP61_03970 [Dactylosporangium sp.]|nr:hypothetical protein [Dactylosporangium sp.]NNJ60108.1 hypothetical protein [Dactylosporangium sp.]
MCQRTVLAALENIQPGQRPTVPAAAVQQIGRDNYLDGFPDAHLGVIAQTILQAIRTVSAEQWSSSLSSIWVQYLMWFQAHLRLGSQAQRAKDMADGGPGAGSPASPGRTAQQRPRPAYGQAGPGDPYPPQRPMDDPRKTQAGSRSEAPRTAAIDKIVVNDGRQQKTLTAAQWKALPLIERAKYLRADPRFYAGGQPIDPREAIATLRS